MALYQAKSLAGAQKEVRRLRKQFAKDNDCICDLLECNKLLAMLCADKPMFHNPLHVAAAKEVRNRVLKQHGLV